MNRAPYLIGMLVTIAFMLVDVGRHTTVAQGQPTSAPLVQQSNLAYKGAFRLPSGTFGGSSFGYGGTALAYNAAKGSLFLVGHDWHQMVAEVKIPQIINSTSLNNLQTATVLQPFTNVTEGHMAEICTGSPNADCQNGVYQHSVKVGGLMALGSRLYGAVYAYYDGSIVQSKSHFYSGMTLASTGDYRGMYTVNAPQAAFVSGYMTTIPSEWQSSLGGPALTGNCCLSIISRTSYGPAAFVFNPNDLGVKNPVPSTPVVYYPSSHPTLGDGGGTNATFNATTQIRGLVFPAGTRSLLFIGRHGTGTYCYGSGGSSGGDCYDPADGSKGSHAYPYVYQVWAYNGADLLAVKNGQKQPWDIKPYAIWKLSLPFGSSNDSHVIGGAAYDPQTRNIFISQMFTDGSDARPVIHVFTVNVGTTPPPSDTIPPAAPAGLRVQ
jgi:hypothetical protein